MTAIGASEVVSTPPAMPGLDLPEGDLVGDEDRRLQAGAARLLDVVGRRGRPTARSRARDSRVRLKSRACLRTAPATTSPSCSPCRPKRATSPSSVGGEHVLVGRLRVRRRSSGRTGCGCRRRSAARRAARRLACQPSGPPGSVGLPVPTVAGTVGHMKAESVRPRRRTRSHGTAGATRRQRRDRRDSRWDEHRRARRGAARRGHARGGRQARRRRRHGRDRRRGRHQQDRRLPALRRPRRAATSPSATGSPRSCCPSCARRSRQQRRDPRADGRRGDRHLPRVPRGRPRALPLRRPPSRSTGPAHRPDRQPGRPRRRAGGGRVIASRCSRPAATRPPPRPWGHGVVGLVRSAADWWLRAERPMLRSELAAHLTDLAWAGLSGVVTTREPDRPGGRPP